MKVVVQIPCLNEEETLPLVLESIPERIDSVDELEILIINDGSSDKTVEIAKQYGVEHFVHHTRNRGLARSFRDGVDKSLELGADIIVNTDGDNQYPQERIPDLLRPIMEGKSDIVIADRQTDTIEHFSPLKKLLQRFGSWIVNKAAGTDIPDAVSGFRAYSRHAAMELNVVTDFSYCTETIIQAGQKRLAIASVPVKTNPKTRESRLFKNMRQHIFQSMLTIIRVYLMYKPFKIFVSTGIVLGVLGVVPFVRFLVLFLVMGDPVGGHIQSLIAGTALIILGMLSIALGFIGELISINRKLHEDTLKRQRKLQHESIAPETIMESAVRKNSKKS